MDPSRVTAIDPRKAVEGGRIAIHGADFPVDRSRLPDVRIAERAARVVFASSTRIDAIVPSGLGRNGRMSVRVDGAASETAFVDVAGPFAAGLHQVDNPVFDRDGNLYVTYSGTRGQRVPVSIFRVRPDGTRETFSSGIVNPTSMAIDALGQLYVSSRFEGVVYRVSADGSAESFATNLGVACGLAFAPDGTLFVGDRSGTIFKVDPDGNAVSFATLPSSIAAFHLALGPDGALYATGPTLAPYDFVYRIDDRGDATVIAATFGRPQGIAFDSAGALFVVEALAGVSGLYRVPRNGSRETAAVTVTPPKPRELVVAGPDLVGVAFDGRGGLVVCSNDSAYRFGYQVV